MSSDIGSSPVAFRLSIADCLLRRSLFVPTSRMGGLASMCCEISGYH